MIASNVFHLGFGIFYLPSSFPKRSSWLLIISDWFCIISPCFCIKFICFWTVSLICLTVSISWLMIPNVTISSEVKYMHEDVVYVQNLALLYLTNYGDIWYHGIQWKVPLLPLATRQLISHDQFSIWACIVWQAAQVTSEFPVSAPCTRVTWRKNRRQIHLSHIFS